MAWCETKFFDLPQFQLCVSQKAFNKALQELDEEPCGFLPKGALAATHRFADKDACIVTLGLRDDHSEAEVVGLLAHEAVHVFQSFLYRIDEDKPSPEFEAYGIQTITQRLWEQYKELVNADGK